jgi:hypothetical protein
MWSELLSTTLCRLIRDCGIPLSDAEISEWERSLCAPLPKDYIEFLRHFNGGSYYDPVQYPMKVRGFGEWDAIDGIGAFNFYGLGQRQWASWRDIGEQSDLHHGRTPEGTVPIGDDAGINLILLDLARGSELVLWQRDAEMEFDRERNRIPIARTFLEFAQGVELEPMEERRPYTIARDEPFISIEVHDLPGLKKWVAANGPLQRLPDAGAGLLRAACFDSDFEGARWLLEQGVDPTGPLLAGVETPIERADSASCGDLTVLLLEHGAVAEHLFREGREPQPYILAFVEQWKAGLRRSTR